MSTSSNAKCSSLLREQYLNQACKDTCLQVVSRKHYLVSKQILVSSLKIELAARNEYHSLTISKKNINEIKFNISWLYLKIIIHKN